MSKILGVIAEYNPLHNGHAYHIKESKKIVDPDYSVCILSGNFVQRGNTSIIDKWSKTEIALKCGFDLVIELPTIYSISSAENFASGALKILQSLGSEVYLSFGCETDNINILNGIVDVLCKEPKEYVSILNHELSLGNSFPKAREKAVLMYLNDVRRYSNVLNGANNILAIEYLKAIKKMKSNIVPIAVKRIGTDYNSLAIKDRLASSTAIRELLNNKKTVRKLMPKVSYEILEKNISHGKSVMDISCFEKEIIYTLRRMTINDIFNLPDVSEGLENKIKEVSNSCNNLDDLISKIKSKRYTQTRIQRILLYALLGITKKDMEDSFKVAPYVRILGLSENGKALLSNIAKKNKHLSIITSPKKFINETSNKQLKRMLEIDILASNIYTLGYEFDSKANLDFTNKLIVL